LEYLFFPEGSLREFAKRTYEWNFQGITAGDWIAVMLQKEFGMECTPFGFSFDREAYFPNETAPRRTTHKRVAFYARPGTEWRGFELGVLALSIVAKKMPDTEFILVGDARLVKLPFRATLPGVLSSRELGALYRSCDAALVLSHTNLSLLPLELMASGCAVVSNSGANVEWLVSNEVAQLADRTPESLADAILTLLSDDGLRAQKVASGLALANGTDWETEIRKIEAALHRGLNIRRSDTVPE
jgi:glycosyltransferase involved in cell wall biosynthesis